MKLNIRFAIFCVALCALSAGTTAQNVYKCGNAYGQKPCADGVLVDVQDSRTPAQKAESDALIKRDSASANAMEKSRLKEEAQQRADNAKLAAATAKKTSTKQKIKASEPADGAASTPKTRAKKKSAKKTKERAYFKALSPPEKPKQASSASK